MQYSLASTPSLLRNSQLSANVARYMGRFSRAVTRPHRVVLPSEAVAARDTWNHNHQEREAWRALFGREQGAVAVPFTVQTSVTADQLFHHLTAMRINFANLLYLEHEVQVPAGPPTELPADVSFSVTADLERVVLMGTDRVALRFCSEVRDEDGLLYRTTRDTFFIKKVPADAMQRLRDDPRVATEGAERYRGLARSEPVIAQYRAHRLEIGGRAGLAFGVVSGDLNLVHITPVFARLFGHRRPFVQGLYTANLAACALSDARGRTLAQLGVTFCRPIYVGQSIELRDGGDAFELVDDEQRLLARGSCGFAATASAPGLGARAA